MVKTVIFGHLTGELAGCIELSEVGLLIGLANHDLLNILME